MGIEKLLHVVPGRSALQREYLACFIQGNNLVESQHVENNCVPEKRLAAHTAPFARNRDLHAICSCLQDCRANFILGCRVNYFADLSAIEPRSVIDNIRRLSGRLEVIRRSDESDRNAADRKEQKPEDGTFEGAQVAEYRTQSVQRASSLVHANQWKVGPGPAPSDGRGRDDHH